MFLAVSYQNILVGDVLGIFWFRYFQMHQIWPRRRPCHTVSIVDGRQDGPSLIVILNSSSHYTRYLRHHQRVVVKFIFLFIFSNTTVTNYNITIIITDKRCFTSCQLCHLYTCIRFVCVLLY